MKACLYFTSLVFFTKLLIASIRFVWLFRTSHTASWEVCAAQRVPLNSNSPGDDSSLASSSHDSSTSVSSASSSGSESSMSSICSRRASVTVCNTASTARVSAAMSVELELWLAESAFSRSGFLNSMLPS
uniref:(northern house mosquito) hypothetical protein n=1 Tax=Culex pipiens TaxID=7175 RepID=A0A8D8JH51_CULPI